MPTLNGIQCRLWSLRGRKPARVCYSNGGIGDELMLTAIAAAARAAGLPLDIIAAYPALWHGNSDPASLQTGVDRWHYASRRGWIPTTVVHLGYQTSQPLHIAEQMAQHVGIKLADGWRPVLHTRLATTRDPRLIVVQNSCSGARYSATTKEWPQDRWQALVRRLAGEFRIVQIGTTSDPALGSTEDLRGRTTLHEAAGLLSGAGCFLGLESGLMHVAAATRSPAVIIYGGRTRPHETGYQFNWNLTRAPSCAGCSINTGCPHELICLDIPVEEVEQAVRKCLASRASEGSEVAGFPADP